MAEFKSFSMSDEELSSIDEWLQKNLGEAGEGREWIIERQKDGSVQAMLLKEDGTAVSRKTIPSSVAPKDPEKFKDPWADFKTEKKADLEPLAPVDDAAPAPKQRDFRRPERKESSVRKLPETARRPRQSSRRGSPQQRYESPFEPLEAPDSKPVKYTKSRDYVAPEKPKEDLPRTIDPKKKRKDSRAATSSAAADAFSEMESEIDKKGEGWEGSTFEQRKMTPQESKDLREKTRAAKSRTAPEVEEPVESPPLTGKGRKKDRPSWVDDERTIKSDPELLRSTSRSQVNSRSEGKVKEFWTDPDDGTTYGRNFELEDLPAEVESEDKKGKGIFGRFGGAVAGAAKGVAGMFDGDDEGEVDDRKKTPSWIDNPPAGTYVGTGKSRDMQIGVNKAMMDAQSQMLKQVGETTKTADGTRTRGTLRNTVRKKTWIDPKTGQTYVLLGTREEEGEKKKTDSKVEIEPERFEGTEPEDVEVESEQIEIDLEDPTIIDALTSPKSPAPVDDPEPIELPFKTKADKRSDTQRVKENNVASDMVIKTQEALGTDWKSPINEIIITSTALEETSSTEPEPPYRLTIDPNINIAILSDAEGLEIRQFAVGTGDTTGTRYGKKYFTPTGTAEIINKVPYEQVEGSYGPYWMGLDWNSYGVHGPHAAKDIKATGTGFENQGFVSHGCIRFMEKDLIDLSNYLEVGSSVEVLPYDTRPNIRGPLRVGAR
jgi:lipoprotein-anchoring transpeptidase ErfK/SrfK